MKNVPYQLNQFFAKPSITCGISEERIFDDSDEDFFEETYEQDGYEEYEDEYSIKEIKWAA